MIRDISAPGRMLMQKPRFEHNDATPTNSYCPYPQGGAWYLWCKSITAACWYNYDLFQMSIFYFRCLISISDFRCLITISDVWYVFLICISDSDMYFRSNYISDVSDIYFRCLISYQKSKVEAVNFYCTSDSNSTPYWWRWVSDITRSIAPDLKGCPHDDLDPLMACIDERRREKVSQQRSQHRVLLYFWSHFEDSMEASLL